MVAVRCRECGAKLQMQAAQLLKATVQNDTKRRRTGFASFTFNIDADDSQHLRSVHVNAFCDWHILIKQSCMACLV